MVYHPYLAAAERQSFILISSRNAHVSRYPLCAVCAPKGRQCPGPPLGCGVKGQPACWPWRLTRGRRPEGAPGGGGPCARWPGGLAQLASSSSPLLKGSTRPGSPDVWKGPPSGMCVRVRVS